MEHKDVTSSVIALGRMANFFSVLGDFTRLSIISLIFEKEYCVNDIAKALSLSQSAVSHQLKVLKDADILKSRREGKQIYYQLNDDHVRDIILITSKHMLHTGGDVRC